MLHVPPETKLFSVVVKPAQTRCVPVILAGIWYTVNVFVAKQLLPSLYVILEVPEDIPFIIPLAEPIVATAVFAEVQVPPIVVFANVIEELEHTPVNPVIAGGEPITVTVVVAKPEVPRE